MAKHHKKQPLTLQKTTALEDGFGFLLPTPSVFIFTQDSHGACQNTEF